KLAGDHQLPNFRAQAGEVGPVAHPTLFLAELFGDAPNVAVTGVHGLRDRHHLLDGVEVLAVDVFLRPIQLAFSRRRSGPDDRLDIRPSKPSRGRHATPPGSEDVRVIRLL